MMIFFMTFDMNSLKNRFIQCAFIDKVSFRTIVFHWFGEFDPGRSSRQDEFRKVRSKAISVPEDVDQDWLACAILWNKDMFLAYIQYFLNIFR